MESRDFTGHIARALVAIVTVDIVGTIVAVMTTMTTTTTIIIDSSLGADPGFVLGPKLENWGRGPLPLSKTCANMIIADRLIKVWLKASCFLF